MPLTMKRPRPRGTYTQQNSTEPRDPKVWHVHARRWLDTVDIVLRETTKDKRPLILHRLSRVGQFTETESKRTSKARRKEPGVPI